MNNESDNYLLSIVAPIRNERHYIEALIESFSRINDPRVELLISDNYSDDDSYEFVCQEKVDNLKIVRPSERLTPFDNHIYAIKKSSGKYVFPVGGDDYISAECIKLILDKLKPGIVLIPILRCFDDITGKTIDLTNTENDISLFFHNNQFSVANYLKFINYDQLIFNVCEREKLNHLQYIKPNTIETFAIWSNIFIFADMKLENIVFMDYILMHKRYNKSCKSATFADDQQYGTTGIFIKYIHSIYNTIIYLRMAKNKIQTFYLLFFNRYAVGCYNEKHPNKKVKRLLTLAPVYMLLLSPFLILRRLIIYLIKLQNKKDI
jgi:glycosyltransferase involved in cell wall biosynthesis